MWEKRILGIEDRLLLEGGDEDEGEDEGGGGGGRGGERGKGKRDKLI